MNQKNNLKAGQQAKYKLWALLSLGLITVIGLGSTLLILKSEESKPAPDNNKGSSQNCPTSSGYLGLDRVELAITQQEQEKGLMNRSQICEDQAMLFVYPQSEYLSFWMKNTEVSLDILFITQNQTIDTIHASTNPRQLIPTYNSSSQCKYVLEAKAGFSKRNGLKVGDKVDIDKIMEISSRQIDSV